MRLLEDAAKAALAEQGLPVPAGRAARRNDDMPAIARELLDRPDASGRSLDKPLIVKALVPTGRRGKSGLVKRCTREELRDAALPMFDQELAGFKVEQVYVEETMEIIHEYYLSFTFVGDSLQVIASRQGGVDIEQTAHDNPECVITREIDPLSGLRSWEAAALWDVAGVPSIQLPALIDVTVRLFQAFVRCDAQMLEINPLVITAAGGASIIGAMMEIDDNALYRHPLWEELARESAGPGGRPLTASERLVSEANRKYPGGATRYIELDGDIGLLVSGGGAGLYQHDHILECGGRPANHTDFSPTPTPDKQIAVLDAIFAKPGLKGLLIGCNYLQLARCDIIIEALSASLKRNQIDTRKFPIVIRLFGPKEAEARAIAAQFPCINYLPPGTSLAHACEAIVQVTTNIS